MIRYLDRESRNELAAFTAAESLCACRIACLLDSYGLSYDFAQFWLQYNDAGQPAAAVSQYGRDVTVQLSPSCDREELTEFLSMIGFSSVLSEEPLPIGSIQRSGVIMTCHEAPPLPSLADPPSVTVSPDLKELHSLLLRCEGRGFTVPSYEDFLLDMSHKLRHGTALCCAAEKDGALRACTMTIALSRHCAVIGGTAADPAYRRRGLASYCVSSLCRRLRRPTLLMRDPEQHEHFYSSLGFRNTGTFYLSFP